MTNTKDQKIEAAKKAVTLINDHSILGLGAGSTIGYLVDFLKQKMGSGFDIQLVTSSFSTRKLLLENGFAVQPISSFSSVDIYFDGCDQLDHHLNALKSGGGIHTNEKILASMASQFVLIGDESKLVENFDSRFPVVIELLPQAVNYVPGRIQEIFPHSKNAYRVSEKTDGYVITENGNYLLDVYFQQWPDLSAVNSLLKSITGVVESSLFYNLAHKALIAGKEGIIILLKFRT